MPADIEKYKSPKLAVDAIVLIDNKVVLIERKNPPYGWALPGGFVDYGESVETAVMRELTEETSLKVIDGTLKHVGVYSAPDRDPRGHVTSIVHSCKATGTPKAQDDAKNIKLFSLDELPELAFDHKNILERYIENNNLLSKDNKEFEYTTDEVREKVLNHIRGMVKYWAGIEKDNVEEQLDGLAFSILTMLDGCSMDLPGFIVAPYPHESDKEYAIDCGKKYYPQNLDIPVKGDIAGSLHDHFHIK